MNLFKTSFYSGVVTLIKISSVFIANKVIAIYTGPSGIALIGSFSNFISIVLTFANGAINNGVVKYTAEFEESEDKLISLFSTSFKITLYCSGFVSVILLFFGPYISNRIFDTQIYAIPIKILSVSVILYSLNSLFISILNGRKEIKTYTIVNIAGSIIGLLLTLVLVYFYKIEGALVALICSQSIIFFVTFYFICKFDWLSLKYFKQKIVARYDTNFRWLFNDYDYCI